MVFLIILSKSGLLQRPDKRLDQLGRLFRYLVNSLLVAGLDTAIVWLLFSWAGLALSAANTVGVISGFLAHYFLSSKSIFGADFGIRGFLIYLATFIFGLFLANFIVVTAYDELFFALNEGWRFLLSKGLSLVIPFFALFFLRSFLYGLLDKKERKTPGGS